MLKVEKIFYDHEGTHWDIGYLSEPWPRNKRDWRYSSALFPTNARGD